MLHQVGKVETLKYGSMYFSLYHSVDYKNLSDDPEHGMEINSGVQSNAVEAIRGSLR